MSKGAPVGVVYLECFNRPYIGRRRPRRDQLGRFIRWPKKIQACGHYIGWTSQTVEARHAQHIAGRGARLLEVVAAEGIAFEITRTWPGGRELERRLKKQKNARRLCPRCNAGAMRRAR